MLFNILAAASILVTSALAVAEPAPYMLGKMSLHNAFGLGLDKRQAGYAPTQTYCGPGDTCAESCGAGYVQCPSTDGEMHCFDPEVNQSCCPDGTGNSCADGYFCTSDSSGNTWCCPDGLSLSACAAAYSLTGVLISETGTATYSAAASSTTPTSVSIVVTSSAGYSTVSPYSYTTSSSTPPTSSTTPTISKISTLSTPSTTSTTPVVHVTTPSSNRTTTSSQTTTSLALQATNAAVQVVMGGLPALAIAAGAFLAL